MIYSVYAVHARDGAIRWKHEPGDFKSTLPYSVEVKHLVLYVSLHMHDRIISDCVYSFHSGSVLVAIVINLFLAVTSISSTLSLIDKVMFF